MVDNIDKSLPNTVEEVKDTEFKEQEVAIPGGEEVITTDTSEVVMDEEGGAEVTFDPTTVPGRQSDGHFANLAEDMSSSDLESLGQTLYDQYTEYKESRGDWEQSYREGLELLGFKYERRTEPFKGASGVNHPVLAEAVTQFQATAYKELLPADGPVRTQILGNVTIDKEEQSKRVKDFMNYQLMDQMKEYEPEFDQMLFYLPLSGSTFKKVYYDELLGRAVSKFVPAEDLIVPYSATSLDDTDAIVHVIKMSGNELRKQQVAGFYRDVKLSDPPVKENQVEEKKLELEGISKDDQQDQYTLYEMHTNLDLAGYEDMDENGNPTGIKLPYIITFADDNQTILSIRRNYQPTDPLKKKISYFVQFKFLPGTGFYGFGLIHMIGGLTRTATSALRQLLDAGTLSNLPAGYKARGLRIRDDDQPLQPGEFRDVDAPNGIIREALMPLPYKGPDAVLMQLLGFCVDAAKQFATVADMQLSEIGSSQTPVGTTMALMERGTKVMSAVHKRLHYAQKKEFNLLARIFKMVLPPVYPFNVPGGPRQIKAIDFDDNIDILPVSDPNIFSMSQRVTLAQNQLQLAQTNPQIHNVREAYRRMYIALGVKDIDIILPIPPQPEPTDPAVENANSLRGQGLVAFRNQNQMAHIDAHRAFMSSALVKNNPPTMAILQAHIMEHVGLQAREEVEEENQQELEQITQQYGGQIPPELQQQFQEAMEQQISEKIALMTEEMVTEEQEVLQEMGEDPLINLKQQEINIKAGDLQRKTAMDQGRLSMDQAKLQQTADLTQDKIDSQEDIAQLRANVNLTKQKEIEKSKKDPRKVDVQKDIKFDN